MLELKSKLVGETITMSFYFKDRMVFGATLSSPSVEVILLSGEDDSPEDMISGSAVVSGAVVTQHIYRGLPGCCYAIICTVEDGSGNEYQIQQNLAVLTDTGSYGEGHGFEINGTLSAEWCLLEYHNETLSLISGYQPYDPPVISSGTAPDGLDFNIVGNTVMVDGIPDDAVGTYNFTISVTDFIGNVVTSPQTIEVRDCQVNAPFRAGGTFLTLGAAVGVAYVSDVNGNNWATISHPSLVGVPFRHCYALPSGRVVASAQAGGNTTFYYSTNYFQSVALSASGPFVGLCQGVAAYNERIVFFLVDGTGYFTVYSDDYGVTWTQGAYYHLNLLSIFNDCVAGANVFGASLANTAGEFYSSPTGVATWTNRVPTTVGSGWNGTGFLIQGAAGGFYYGTTASSLAVTGGSTGGALAYTIIGRSGYFCIGTFTDGIWKTTNNGVNFTKKYNSAARFYKSAQGGPVIVMGPGGGGSNEIVTSVDDGENFAATFASATVGLCYMPP